MPSSMSLKNVKVPEGTAGRASSSNDLSASRVLFSPESRVVECAAGPALGDYCDHSGHMEASGSHDPPFLLVHSFLKLFPLMCENTTLMIDIIVNYF